MLYDDYANLREPVTAARARTRSRTPVNGRMAAGRRNCRQSCNARVPAIDAPCNCTVPYGALDKFGKKGSLWRGETGAGQRGFLEKCGKPMTHSLLRHAAGTLSPLTH